jgi:hypothetical protein
MILNTLALIPAIVSARKAAYGISVAAIALGVCMVSFLPPAPWPLYLPTVALVFLAMLMLKQSASKNPITPC